MSWLGRLLGKRDPASRTWEERWNEPGFYEHAVWGLETEELPPEVRQVVESSWFPPGASVLDIGCGNGIISNLLSKAGCRVLGVDFAPSAIEQAKRRHGTGPNPRFRLADVTRDRIGETFDCLLDRGCYHTLPVDQHARFLKTLSACSRSGSHLWLLTRDECTKGLKEGFAREGFRVQRTARATIRKGDRAQPTTIFWMTRD